MSDDRTGRHLTIREVSEDSGLTPHTLRYYERIGLMIPVERTEGGHRHYTEAAVEWVTLLRHLRDTGMPIADMSRFAELVRQGPDSVPDRLHLLQGHRNAITRQIAVLTSALGVLEDKIAVYAAGEAVTPPTPGRPGE